MTRFLVFACSFLVCCGGRVDTPPAADLATPAPCERSTQNTPCIVDGIGSVTLDYVVVCDDAEAPPRDACVQDRDSAYWCCSDAAH